MKLNNKILIHVSVWLFMLLFPLFFFLQQGRFNWIHFSLHILMTAVLMFIFYSNYLWVTKKYFSKDGMKQFLLYNLGIVILSCTALFSANRLAQPSIDRIQELRIEEMLEQIHNSKNESISQNEAKEIAKRNQKKYNLWDVIMNIFAFLCMIGTAVAVRSIQEIYLTEEKRKDEERSKVEAELKMLKNQLNPHFLFNTLNNIYALIAIDQDKSQNAVMELSKLLRYMLYESDQKEVPLSKEIEFINNYVELMKIRLSSKTEVNVHTDISKNESITVAAQLFISLIENAFKHGVSNQQPSFIHFSIDVEEGNTIVCKLENSYFPKSEEHDKSGSGIGIENMKRRLELIYPEHHDFTMGVENNVYKSQITIHKTNI